MQPVLHPVVPFQEVTAQAALLHRSNSATPAVSLAKLTLADFHTMESAPANRSSSATPAVVIVPVVR